MSHVSKTKMPPDVAETHKLLGQQLWLLNARWNDYKMLYCTDDETVQLLEDTASFFFQMVREVLRDDIILTLCRITDPAASTVQGAKRGNLTIQYLISIIPPADGTVKQRLSNLPATIKGHCGKMRVHRNRRVAHADLETKLKRSNGLLPGIGIAYVDAALKSIADLLNAVELYYDDNERPYHNGTYSSEGASALIDFIRRANELEKDYNNREFGDPM